MSKKNDKFAIWVVFLLPKIHRINLNSSFFESVPALKYSYMPNIFCMTANLMPQKQCNKMSPIKDVEKPKFKHNKWTKSEDQLLIKLVNNSYPIVWTYIAEQFPNRNKRQCFERWNYYLSPNVNNSDWTKEEDQILLEKYKLYGSKWTKIAKYFKGRTNTNIKNRFLALQRQGKKPIEEPNDETQKEAKERVILPSILSLDNYVPIKHKTIESIINITNL